MIDSNGKVLSTEEILRRVRNTDKDFIRAAQEMYQCGLIRIDDDAEVSNPSSPGENFGRMVSAWVYVPTVSDIAGD